ILELSKSEVKNPLVHHYLDHFVNSHEVEGLIHDYLHSDSSEKTLNDILRDVLIQSNYLFKVSSKKIDFDPAEIKSDSLMPEKELHSLINSFVLKLHSFIRDDTSKNTIYFRTSEQMGRYQV